MCSVAPGPAAYPPLDVPWRATVRPSSQEDRPPLERIPWEYRHPVKAAVLVTIVVVGLAYILSILP